MVTKSKPIPVSFYDLVDWLETEYADPGQRWAQLRQLLEQQLSADNEPDLPEIAQKAHARAMKKYESRRR